MSTREVVIVNVVITALSMLGGAGIVIGYFCSPAIGRNRLRQRLVLGLGITDLIQALDVLIGSSMNLGGHRFETNSQGCNAIGFIYQTCVVTSAGWTLSIASITYITLVHPMSRIGAAVESDRAVWYLWGVIWTCGLIPAIFGTIFFKMMDYGGVCWYPTNSLEAKIMIFIPRALALLGVIVLYTCLFIFFRRRDLSLLQSSGSEQDEDETGTNRRYSLAHVSHKLANWGRRASGTPHGTVHSYVETFSPAMSPPLSPAYEQPRPAFLHRGSQSITISLPPSGAQDGTDSADSTSEFPETAVFSGPTPAGVKAVPTGGGHLNSFAAGQGAAAQPKLKRLSPRQINKRLSILMMLYPLAYLILFSVSVGRLTESLITTKHTRPALLAASRWLVYGQGAVDGVLYFVIEYLFRRSTRGRT